MGATPFRPKTFLIPATVGAALLGACATDAGETPMINTLVADSAGTAGAGVSMEVGQSPFGNYLAGRHAQKKNDFSAAADLLSRALGESPDNEQLRRRAFLAQLSDGHVKEAIALSKGIVDTDNISPIARLTGVVDAVKAGDLATAEAELLKFPERGFSGFMKPLLLGWSIVGQGRGDDALAALEPLKKQSGLRVLYELHAGLISDAAGKSVEAVGHFKRAGENARRSTLRVVQALGSQYERAGETALAKDLYNAYISENPDSVVLQPALKRIEEGRKPAPLAATAAEGVAEALFNIASTMTRENSAQLALIYGRLAIYLRPQFDLAQMLVGGLLESMDRYENAIATYNEIDKSSPLYWSAQLRVTGNLEALDRDEDAIKLLTALAREFPDRPDSLVSLGDIYRANKKYLESVAAYDQALEVIGDIDQRHWTLLYSRGISLERSNQWPRAEQDFRKALELNPEQPYVLNYLGYSWVDKGLNLIEAREMIERAVELRPDDGYIVDSLGWVLYRLNDFEGAVEKLERAVELRPQDPTINDHLGDAYWRVGRLNEARFQWRRALTLKPEPEMVSGIEDKIRNGLGAATAGDRDS